MGIMKDGLVITGLGRSWLFRGDWAEPIDTMWVLFSVSCGVSVVDLVCWWGCVGESWFYTVVLWLNDSGSCCGLFSVVTMLV